MEGDYGMLGSFEDITKAGIERKVYQLRFTRIMSTLYETGRHTLAKNYLDLVIRTKADELEIDIDEIEELVEKLYDYTFKKNAFTMHHYEMIPVLREAGYNPTEIAEISGIARPTVYANLDKVALQLHMLNDGIVYADNMIVNKAIKAVVDFTLNLLKGAVMLHGKIV